MIKLAQTLLRRHSWTVALLQAMLISFSLVLAWLLRFDFTLPYRVLLFSSLPLLVLIRLAAIARFQLLHGWWNYTGLSDALDVFKAVTVGSVAFILFMHFVLDVTGFPRSVYILEPLLTAVFLIGVRMSSRVLAESVRQDMTSCKKAILIGAGTAAQTAVREVKRQNIGYAPVGYVDDDPSKKGLKIDGIPVIGSVAEIPQLVGRYHVDEILIAVPSASGKQMQRFVEICERAEVKFRTVPALRDIIAGRMNINQFRDVRVEDLLGRDLIEINLESVKNEILNRVVVVTGAAGTIGSELCRQIVEYEPGALLCVDQNETGMFYLQRELAKVQNGTSQIFCVADVGDRERMQSIFMKHSPDIMFHAAAYKHVPVMEENVPEAVKNNIFSLVNLLEVAQQNGCQAFVLISSDKAVNPTSVMGATKRIAELLVSSQPAHGMRCVSVRFGNVLGSSGSVIPVLQEQLRNNQPLTITDPRVNRFFMTTQEAVSLVLQAFAIGERGDTLVLDMGSPIRILDLARTLIRLSGKTEQQVDIMFTGLREGEKLTEELFYSTEEISPTSFPKIKKTRNPVMPYNDLLTRLEELRATLFLDGAAPIRAKIKELVPEYLPSSNCTITVTRETERLAKAVGL